MAGELSNVASKLSSAYEKVFEDNPQLANRLRQSISDDVVQAYKDAYDTSDAQDALISAAASGALEDDYSGVYRQFPELRSAVKAAGRSAFSDSDKKELARAASNADISRLYTMCVTGEIDEVASQLSLDDTPSTAGECQAMVSQASGLAESYDSLYNE